MLVIVCNFFLTVFRLELTLMVARRLLTSKEINGLTIARIYATPLEFKRIVNLFKLGWQFQLLL